MAAPIDRTGHFDKNCLYSVVKNISGVDMVFGFLPPHGVKLTAGEEYTIFGNVLEAIGVGPDRSSARRHHQALANALDRKDLDIIQTPSPIILDTNGASKTLHSASGTLSTAATCWNTSDSLDATAPA